MLHTGQEVIMTNYWVKIEVPTVNKNLAMLDHDIMAKFSGPTLPCLINKCNQEMQYGQVKNNQLVLVALPL